MERTYRAGRRFVKPKLSIPPCRADSPSRRLLVLLPAVALPPVAQGLPAFAPDQPGRRLAQRTLASSPTASPSPGRWSLGSALDYASAIEYNDAPPRDYVLDTELLRLRLRVARDLGPQTFVLLDAQVGGALRRVPGRLPRLVPRPARHRGPRSASAARRTSSSTRIDAAGRQRGRSGTRATCSWATSGSALGLRLRPALQTVALADASDLHRTGGLRARRGLGGRCSTRCALRSASRLIYEGSLRRGLHADARPLSPVPARATFVAASSGLRSGSGASSRSTGTSSTTRRTTRDTTLPSLDRRELSLDFGWMLATKGGASGGWG